MKDLTQRLIEKHLKALWGFSQQQTAEVKDVILALFAIVDSKNKKLTRMASLWILIILKYEVQFVKTTKKVSLRHRNKENPFIIEDNDKTVKLKEPDDILLRILKNNDFIKIDGFTFKLNKGEKRFSIENLKDIEDLLVFKYKRI